MSDLAAFLRFYNKPNVVGNYLRKNFLCLPEIRLLGLLREKWGTLRMLDVGIGGGRTSLYFADLCAHYVGVDYSPEMVTASKERLKDRWNHDVRFEQADATAMPEYADGSFDLVLFSYNGIDGMEWDARERTLREMKRVCAPGGVVAFSSHSLYSIPSVLRRRPRRHPVAWWRERQRVAGIVARNEPQERLMAAERTIFYDTTAGDNHLAHVRPEKQLEELARLGFGKVRMFSQQDGLEITTPEMMREDRHSWILYVCEV